MRSKLGWLLIVPPVSWSPSSVSLEARAHSGHNRTAPGIRGINERPSLDHQERASAILAGVDSPVASTRTDQPFLAGEFGCASISQQQSAPGRWNCCGDRVETVWRFLPAASMRVEVWVSSPEPAVGVFTTAGTCQGRLWCHRRDRPAPGARSNPGLSWDLAARLGPVRGRCAGRSPSGTG